ncbi:MAG TPA: hypothetical protein VKZ94_00785 [Advenella sp.]|nr:hypothetical protein [Advenella sp.]
MKYNNAKKEKIAGPPRLALRFRPDIIGRSDPGRLYLILSDALYHTGICTLLILAPTA